MQLADEKKHRQIVLVAAIGARILAGSLIYLASFLPPFDSSHLVHNPDNPIYPTLTRWASSQLRWDAFHFAHIAQARGYTYEYEYAFMPGVPIVMRLGAVLARATGVEWMVWESTPSVHQLLAGGSIISLLCDSSLSLYESVKLRSVHLQ